ncbi:MULTISPECIES: tripartite tricarboxylate transporter substrate binding protein [unclassified Polaromonas]|uniref:Bug family tripartite tricarboxylate transporter substrate binding protein n=1 Tax=unclassified Polaromonas TaxID=2638319 RepID=UPI0018C9A1C7|nr:MULTISPECIES: tripartite tricarboxylate transporter substrate binding protein [unclassified Polaromonas]MBG6072639.1 tripartite-type tricarboxylate transporter receptor subunit TctC [Polaromonas sp. CG_9.7]MBG6114641.1 tripartite-type tricarboxylate transporter receptor subunit TctC [Polaromonas sp. CG_9.2]MDH6185195.1 tripartite-type tricarboxylate transporter receptor subunit TctC [Polaromonas sp. CG_23.6]
MSKRRLALITIAFSAIVFIASTGAALAQSDYPNKPVKIIVPFPAGGTSDVMGRLVAEELGKILKQPFIVENIGGAGGVIGTERGAKATPDGYTLIQTGVGQNAVAHGLEPFPKYDSNTDFMHISQVHSGPNVLVVHPSTPFKTVKELVDYAKANPGKLDYGYTPAASGHMAMEQFKQTAGIFMLGIPYRGGGPMMTDILGGTIKMMFINQDVALQHVKAGKLRPLAVSSAQRNALYPDVPTVAESGYKGFEALSWSGISAPRGTPQPIVDKLEAALVQAMESPAVKQRLESQGFVVPVQGAKHYAGFVKSEEARWTRVIKTAGIKTP